MDVETIRSQVPALSKFVWFQNGFVSLTPTPIAEEHARLMRELYENGPMHLLHPDVEVPRRAASVDRIAEFLHVDTDEVALKLAVSDGFNTVINGMEWRDGDQIIATEEEAAAILGPSLHLKQTRGVDTFKAPMVDDIEGQVSAIADLITDRTRLIAFSHVTTETGFRLPATQICRVARERGVLTFVDMAHSVGLYDIDLHEMDCDFAGVSNYKWTYSPYACGVLYVRVKASAELQYAASPNRGLNLKDPIENVLRGAQFGHETSIGPVVLAPGPHLGVRARLAERNRSGGHLGPDSGADRAPQAGAIGDTGADALHSNVAGTLGGACDVSSRRLGQRRPGESTQRAMEHRNQIGAYDLVEVCESPRRAITCCKSQPGVLPARRRGRSAGKRRKTVGGRARLSFWREFRIRPARTKIANLNRKHEGS